MDHKEMFLDMLSTQHQLNCKVNPSWIKAGIEGTQDFGTAAICEVVEFVESEASYKWWVQKKADLNNCVVELIDIFHFAMSLDIVESHRMLAIDLDNIPETVTRKVLGDIAGAYARVYEHVSKDKGNKDFSRVQASKDLIAHFCDRLFYAQRFFSLCFSVELDAQTLYSRYVAKAVLNEFRQRHGYKSGTYKKVWTVNGVTAEDNKFLLKWLAGPEVAALERAPTRTEIYNFLGTTYSVQDVEK